MERNGCLQAQGFAVAAPLNLGGGDSMEYYRVYRVLCMGPGSAQSSIKRQASRCEMQSAVLGVVLPGITINIVSQSVLYYRNYVCGIKVITNADVPLIRGLLCYLLPGRSTYYEDFSIYIMGLSSVNYF